MKTTIKTLVLGLGFAAAAAMPAQAENTFAKPPSQLIKSMLNRSMTGLLS